MYISFGQIVWLAFGDNFNALPRVGFPIATKVSNAVYAHNVFRTEGTIERMNESPLFDDTLG